MNMRRSLPLVLISGTAPLVASAPAQAAATICDDNSSAGLGYEFCIQTVGTGLKVDGFQVKARAGSASDPRNVEYRIIQSSNTLTDRVFAWRTVSMNDRWVSICPSGATYLTSPCGTYPTSGWTLKAEWRAVNPGFWERNLRDTSGTTASILIK